MQLKIHIHLLPLLLLIGLMGCNGVKEDEILGDLEGVTSNSSLLISPSISRILVNQSQQFSAAGGEPPFTFSVVTGQGTITSDGLYTAPSGKGTATVRLTDGRNTNRDALVIIDVAVTISPSSRKVNASDSFQFSVAQGTPPYTFSITSGDSTVDSNGIFTASSSAEVALVRVTDAHGLYADSTIEVGNGPVISPILATTPESSTYQFSVSSGTLPLTWAVMTGVGSINSSGLYTATASSGTATIRVTDANGFYTESQMTVSKGKLVAAGSNHTCVLNKVDNTVKCMGYRANGQTGDGKFIIGDSLSDMGDNLPKVKFPSSITADPTIMSTSMFNGCAIFSDGLTRCWGYSGHGQNGNNTVSLNMVAGTTEGGMQPVPMDLANPIVDLSTKSSSAYHNCGLYQDGTVKCWGYNGYGQLGQDNILNYGSNYTTVSIYTALPISLGQTARKVDTGYYHSCAILNDKNVKCWGYNAYGQLGLQHANNTGDAAGEMATVTALNFAQDVEHISIGAYHNCVLFANSTVTCWGYGPNGELGRENATTYGDGAGEDPTLLTPINFGAGRTVLQIDSGFHHSCALLDNFKVKCWGYNAHGQLGLGHVTSLGNAANQMGDNLAYVDLGTGRTATKIFAGGYGSCAYLDNGTTKCWGYNGETSVGTGATPLQNIGDGAGEMGDALLAVDWGSSVTNVLQIMPSQYSTCALLDEGSSNSIKCLGRNESGSIGLENIAIGDEPGDLGSQISAVDFGTTDTIASIVAGADYTCAHFSDGKARCWGYNYANVLGTNGGPIFRGISHHLMGTNLTPVIINPGLTIKKMAGNRITYGFACAILSNDALKCWGYNGYGMLGNDSVGNIYDIVASPAINVGAGRYAIDMALGGYHTCAVLDNKTVKCWGHNGQGQLGRENVNQLGDTAGEMAALTSINLGTGVLAEKIYAGERHNCVITSLGKVKCWGQNTEGQAGVGHVNNIGDGAGEMGDSLPYVNLGTGRTAVKLSMGAYFTCALLDNAKVKCWGQNHVGQAGLGHTIYIGTTSNQMGDFLPYSNMGTGRTVVDITSGFYHSCAVLDNNDVKCWGYNIYGQLGQGHVLSLGDNLNEMGNNLLPLALE